MTPFNKYGFDRTASSVKEDLLAIVGMLDAMYSSGKHTDLDVNSPPVLCTGLDWIEHEAKRMRQQVTLAYVFGADTMTMRPLS